MISDFVNGTYKLEEDPKGDQPLDIRGDERARDR
jgi:hypothetical protein